MFRLSLMMAFSVQHLAFIVKKVNLFYKYAEVAFDCLHPPKDRSVDNI